MPKRSVAFNPNIEFVIKGTEKGTLITPWFKTTYTFHEKVGVGFENYGALGSFKKILSFKMQEHLIGPMIDLYVHPQWEFNGGVLLGLTKSSNQHIPKILIGRRIGK